MISTLFPKSNYVQASLSTGKHVTTHRESWGLSAGGLPMLPAKVNLVSGFFVISRLQKNLLTQQGGQSNTAGVVFCENQVVQCDMWHPLWCGNCTFFVCKWAHIEMFVGLVARGAHKDLQTWMHGGFCLFYFDFKKVHKYSTNHKHVIFLMHFNLPVRSSKSACSMFESLFPLRVLICATIRGQQECL